MRANSIALGAHDPAPCAGSVGAASAPEPSSSADRSASQAAGASIDSNNGGEAATREPSGRETWLPAAPASASAARSIVREAAIEAGLDGECTWDLMLATTEAVANAVQHGKAWPNDCILLKTEPCARGLRVEVCDCGTFDSPPPPAPLEATFGRGIPIIAAIVDRLEVKNGNGRTLVRFERHATAA